MSEKQRVILVDDEAPARELLREMVEEHGGFEVVAACANGFDAVKAVTELAPDLLLLDIQMPKLDGFEVIELLGDDAPPVIFTTAYDRYALEAFAIHAVDYLLKPFSQERLDEALGRVAARPGGGAPSAGPVTAELAEAARSDDGPIDRILVRDGAEIHVVQVHRLDYVEAQDDCVRLVAGDLDLRKSERLGRLEASLDPKQFVRIHRSYLLNVERLAKLELYAKDSRLAILRDGTRLPVSRSGYARLRQLL